MAYIDSTPDGLMPAPLAVQGEEKAPPVAHVAHGRVEAATGRWRFEALALAAIVASFAGLIFALAMVTIASLGIALVVTAMTLLPIASLATGPSDKGR